MAFILFKIAYFMKPCLFISLIFLLISCHKRNIDGVYSGLEEMCSIDSTGKKVCYADPVDPNKKWYHLSILKIKNGHVFMDQSPVGVFRNDTSYSASDGGFFYYRGSTTTNGDSIVLNLIQLSCDYCAQRIKNTADDTTVETKRLSGHSNNLDLVLNGILFKKLPGYRKLESEHY